MKVNQKNLLHLVLWLILCAGLFTSCANEEMIVTQGTHMQQEDTSVSKKPFKIAYLAVRPQSPSIKENSAIVNNVRYAMQMVAESYPSYDFQFTSFDNKENYANEIQLSFLSGQPYDAFDSTLLPVFTYAKSGYLADIYETIRQYGDKEQYFTNALDAFSYDGKLYAFPIGFAYKIVGINTTLLNEDTEYYLNLDTITYQQLLEVYQKSDNSQQLAFSDTMHFNDLAYSEMNMFINDKTLTCDFTDNRFFDLLDFVRVFADKCGANDGIAPATADYWVYLDSEEKYLQDHYAFSIRSVAYPNHTHFAFEEPYFLHYIPLVNSEGSILIDTFRSFSMNNTTEQAVGLAFMNTYAKVYRSSNGNDIRLSIIKKDYANKINSVLQGTISYCIILGSNKMIGQIPPGDPLYDLEVGGWSNTAYYPYREEQTARVTDFLHKYEDYPMDYTKKYINSYDPFEKDLKRYVNGAIKARKLAADVQNGMTLFLIE